MAVPAPPPLKKFWGWPTPVQFRTVSFPWNAILPGQPTTRHAGSDVVCPVGTPLRAMTNGTVYYVGDSDSSGWIIQIKMIGQERTWNLQHCSKILARVGDPIQKGQLIAISGQTGNATAPMVHIGASINTEVGSYSDNSMTFDVMKWCLDGAVTD